ncbi:MAG: hypothetical protein ABEI74_00760 [Candidatus Pacearchaeota archaeon]
MRYLISRESKKYLFEKLKKVYSANSLKSLANSVGYSKKTLQDWFYNENRYVPGEILSEVLDDKIRILKKVPENWGKSLGGKRAYSKVLEKYGEKEMKKRRSNGGKVSSRNQFGEDLNIGDNFFLELYGVLLGDGWLGKYQHKNKVASIIGISGHYHEDREYFKYLISKIKEVFGRIPYLKNKERYNAIELHFSHKHLFDYLSNDLHFPVGRKTDLKIHEKIYYKAFTSLKHVLRGIFDTDGSFYLDKTPAGNPYPCISIQMKSPNLVGQIYKILVQNNFKPVLRKERCMVTLKGSKQITKWSKEIGSSNSKHFTKMRDYARVAQLDRAQDS